MQKKNGLNFTRWKAWFRWSNKLENIWNIELGENTKLVWGLPKTKQVNLEHAKKNLRRCERWLAEPPLLYYIVLVLLSSHIRRVSVSSMQDFSLFSSLNNHVNFSSSKKIEMLQNEAILKKKEFNINLQNASVKQSQLVTFYWEKLQYWEWLILEVESVQDYDAHCLLFPLPFMP